EFPHSAAARPSMRSLCGRSSMRVWDLRQGTLQQFAADLAQSGGLTEAEHYQLLLAAIWLGEISATLQGNPITPELLRNGLRLFDGRWCGATSLVVKPEHAGKRLDAVLRKLYPTLNPDALARMVNGYAPPEIPEDERVPRDPKERPPAPTRYIFLDGAPTEVSAQLREGQWIALPKIEPFISDVPFEVLAKLPWPEGYSDKYRKAYLDELFLE